MQRKPEGNFYQFWIASSPFFESTLFFAGSPVSALKAENSPNQENTESTATSCAVDLTFTDADGELVNESRSEFSRSGLGGLELSQFMEPFKYEGGMRHGLVTVKSDEKLAVICRIHAQNSATLLGALPRTDTNYRAFFPVRFGEGRKSLLALINLSREVSNMKCKLFLGKRNPEIVCQVPAGGARLLNLEAEFAEYADLGNALSMGYLRVTPRQDIPFAAQILERVEGVRDEGIFTSLT